MPFPDFRALRNIPVSKEDIVEAFNREAHPLLRQIREWLLSIRGETEGYVWTLVDDGDGGVSPEWTSAASVTVPEMRRPELEVVDLSRTTELEDEVFTLAFNNGSGQTFTVPPESSVAFPDGVIIRFYQKGAGQLTVAEGAGVTVRTAETLKLRRQYSGGELTKLESNIWLLVGDLELT